MKLEITGAPPWLSFDQDGWTFVGVPQVDDIETTTIGIIANQSCLESNPINVSIGVGGAPPDQPGVNIQLEWSSPAKVSPGRRRQTSELCKTIDDGFVRASILESVAAISNVSVASLALVVNNPMPVEGRCVFSADISDNGMMSCELAEQVNEALKSSDAAFEIFFWKNSKFATKLPSELDFNPIQSSLGDRCLILIADGATSGDSYDDLWWLFLLILLLVLLLLVAGLLYRRRNQQANHPLAGDKLYQPRRPTVLHGERQLADSELENGRRPTVTHTDGIPKPSAPAAVPYLSAVPPEQTAMVDSKELPPPYRLPPAYFTPHHRKYDARMLPSSKAARATAAHFTEITTTTTTTRHGLAPAYWAPPDYSQTPHHIVQTGSGSIKKTHTLRQDPANRGTAANSPSPPPFVHPPEYLSVHAPVVGASEDAGMQGTWNSQRHTQIVPDHRHRLVSAAHILSSSVIGGVSAAEAAAATSQHRPESNIRSQLVTAAGELSFSVSGGVQAADRR